MIEGSSGWIRGRGEEVGKKKNDDDREIADVLHDLFNFGPNSNIPKIKSARKQSNPTTISPITHNNNPPLLLFNNNNININNNNNCYYLNHGDDVDVDETRDLNLAGFSKTEVTVIDTSYESWKFNKLLFRNKNVWKIGISTTKNNNNRKKLSPQQPQPSHI